MSWKKGLYAADSCLYLLCYLFNPIVKKQTFQNYTSRLLQDKTDCVWKVEINKWFTWPWKVSWCEKKKKQETSRNINENSFRPKQLIWQHDREVYALGSITLMNGFHTAELCKYQLNNQSIKANSVHPTCCICLPGWLNKRTFAPCTDRWSRNYERICHVSHHHSPVSTDFSSCWSRPSHDLTE